MSIDFLLQVFREKETTEAVVWKDQAYTYGWLLNRIDYWRERIAAEGLGAGTVVILEADFSPNAVALFFALVDHGRITLPLIQCPEAKRAQIISVAEGEIAFKIDKDDGVTITPLANKATHPLYQQLRAARRPGLVIFSSGSTGESKGGVHDFFSLLERFKTRRPG